MISFPKHEKISVSDPPKFLTRVGRSTLICRPAAGGILVAERRPDGGAQLSLEEGVSKVTLAPEEFGTEVAALARYFLGAGSLDELADACPDVPEEGGPR